ncbi:MAG TPA: acetoacetate decarboxylase family protein [Turneriella sp.]|nr:acetoacetate decarboxylase family protein [Turneriella sp.]
MPQNKEYPPPWHLTGAGVIIFFPAHKERVLDSLALGEGNRASFAGGMGAVMLVRYQDAECGPYDELLYIPGFFKHQGRTYLRIAKIFVSTPQSVEWGRRNWAIPKELARFAWQQGKKEWHIDVKETHSEKNIYSISLSPRFFSFPISTALLPWSLLQKQEERYSDGGDYFLETRLAATGTAKICFIDRVEGSKVFPDYHDVSHGPRIAFAIDPFRMTFPVAKKVR